MIRLEQKTHISIYTSLSKILIYSIQLLSKYNILHRKNQSLKIWWLENQKAALCPPAMPEPSVEKQQHWSIVVFLTLGDDAGILHFCFYESCDSHLCFPIITFVFLPRESFYICWIPLLLSLCYALKPVLANFQGYIPLVIGHLY